MAGLFLKDKIALFECNTQQQAKSSSESDKQSSVEKVSEAHRTITRPLAEKEQKKPKDNIAKATCANAENYTELRKQLRKQPASELKKDASKVSLTGSDSEAFLGRSNTIPVAGHCIKDHSKKDYCEENKLVNKDSTVLYTPLRPVPKAEQRQKSNKHSGEELQTAKALTAEEFANLPNSLRKTEETTQPNNSEIKSTSRNTSGSYTSFRERLNHLGKWGKRPVKSYSGNTDGDNVKLHGLIEDQMHSDLQVFRKPQRLITLTEEGSFIFDENVLNEISKICKRFLVITVLGARGQGKTYLMNKLAQGKAGFPLGHSHQSKAKGVWVMCRELRTEGMDVIMLLETEGFSDTESIATDYKILRLAIMMSNVVCYNTFGVSDHDVFRKLQMLSEMMSEIMFRNIPRQFDCGIRDFLFCVDEFILNQISSGNDKTLSEKEYWNEVLNFLSSKEVENAQNTDQLFCMRNNFRTGKCFTFERPLDNETMAKLNKLEYGELSPGLLDDTRRFLSYVYSGSVNEKLVIKESNGGMFASFLRCYAASIESEFECEVTTLLQKRFHEQNIKLVGRTYDSYTQKLEEMRFPLDCCLEQMDKLLTEDYIEDKLKVFDTSAQQDHAKISEQQARIKMYEKRQEIRKMHADKIYDQCYREFARLYDRTICSKKLYFRPMGHISYTSQMIFLRLNYMPNGKDILKYRAYVTFMKEKYEEDKEIKAEDERSTLELEQERRTKVQNERKKQLQTLQSKLNRFQVEKNELRGQDLSNLRHVFMEAIAKKERNIASMQQTSPFCPGCKLWLCKSWTNSRVSCR